MERIDYKKEVRKMRQKKALLFLSVVIIILSLSVSAFLGYKMIVSAEYFKVKNIIISGVENQSKKIIDNVLNKYKGESIFKIDTGLLRRKLKDFPRIKNVILKRKLPDSLIVKIGERIPIALININKGNLYNLFSIDKDGFLIAEGKDIIISKLPVITGIRLEQIYVGDKINIFEIKKILNVLDVLKEKNKDLFNIINEINLNKKYKYIHYKIYLGNQNIAVSSDVIDMYLFEKIDSVLKVYKDIKNVKAMISYDNNIVIQKNI